MAQLAPREFCLSLVDLAALFKREPKIVLTDLIACCGSQRTVSHIQPATVRRYLYAKGFRFPQMVVSFQMLKGGVAKTTSALNFGLRAAMYGARVLFIDLDQQANLTFALGVDSGALPVWLDIVERKVTLPQARITIEEGVHLIPSSLNNSVLDRVLLNSHRNWAQTVKGPLAEVLPEYDLVVIDTAPNLSVINTAVTCASDLVVLPINPDKFSMLGLTKHRQDLQELKAEFSLNFQEKILFTKFDGREGASRDFLLECLDLFEDSLLKHYIRTSSEVKNSIGSSRTLFSTKSKAKEDYDLVTQELLGMVEYAFN